MGKPKRPWVKKWKKTGPKKKEISPFCQKKKKSLAESNKGSWFWPNAFNNLTICCSARPFTSPRTLFHVGIQVSYKEVPVKPKFVIHTVKTRFLYKAPFTRIRIFLNPQLFLSGYGYHASGDFASKSGNF